MSRLSFIFLSLLMMLMAAPAALAADGAPNPPIPWLWWLGPIGSIIAFVFVFVFYNSVMKEGEGTETMAEIAQAVREDQPSPIDPDGMLLTNVIIQGVMDSAAASGKEVPVTVPTFG